MSWRHGFSGLVVVLILCASQPALASFGFCNKTSQTLEAAFGYREKEKWNSEGWWRLEPAQCIQIYAPPLNQRYYFYFGRTIAGPLKIWGGKYQFCTDSKPFQIQGDSECEVRGYAATGFARIEVNDKREFVLDFNE